MGLVVMFDIHKSTFGLCDSIIYKPQIGFVNMLELKIRT